MSTPSLLLVPARLKDGTLFSQIPTNGSGDFTVVQAVGNATRVNASGFVESAKTNLAFNSQTWDASNNWQLTESSGRVTVATATSGTTAPDGLSTANAITPTSGNITHYLYSNASGSITYVSGTVYTISAFFKKGGGDSGRYVQVAGVGSRFLGNPFANFDLELGTALTVSGSVADSNRVSRIQNFGNGWYRCSLTATCNNSGVSSVGVLAALLTADTNARLGAAFAGNTSDYIFGWGAQLEVGSSASDYIATTTVARTKFSGVTVNGTSIANIPRLDYYTSSGTPGCPGLLVEPAGTNFARGVELLNTPSPATVSGGITVTTGSTDFLAPDGSSGTITKYVGGTASGSNFVEYVSSTSVSASGVHTFSAFVKTGATNPLTFCALQFTVYTAASGTATSYFNLASGTALTAGASIQNYGNGWYRIISAPYTIASGDLAGSIRLVFAEGNNDASWPASGALNLTLYAWGIQLEAGSVATSYIPTTTGSVTRNADVISASGNVSGSIGQTEGSIYAEVNIQKLLGTTQRAFVDIGQAGNRLFLGYGNGLTDQIRFLLQTSGGGLVDFQSATTTTGTIRIAVGYKNNDSAMYVNGVKVSPVSNGSFTASLSGLTQLSIGSSFSVGETHYLNDRINAVALYATRLSDDALMLLSMQGNDTYLPQAIWNFYVNSRTGNTEVPTCLYERHADIIDV